MLISPSVYLAQIRCQNAGTTFFPKQFNFCDSNVNKSLPVIRFCSKNFFLYLSLESNNIGEKTIKALLEVSIAN
jgi:hypothetical protein